MKAISFLVDIGVNKSKGLIERPIIIIIIIYFLCPRAQSSYLFGPNYE